MKYFVYSSIYGSGWKWYNFLCKLAGKIVRLNCTGVCIDFCCHFTWGAMNRGKIITVYLRIYIIYRNRRLLNNISFTYLKQEYRGNLYLFICFIEYLTSSCQSHDILSLYSFLCTGMLMYEFYKNIKKYFLDN